MKVLLIGNGCSAGEQKYGPIIDSEFDIILRMNRFKTKGYEEYVGTKTNVWVVTDNMFQHLYKETKEVEGSLNWKSYGAVYLGVPTFKLTNEHYSWGDDLDIPVFVYPPFIADSVAEKIQMEPGKWPTLGIQTLYALMGDEDYKDIYIYGFDGKDPKYKYLHYYDTEPQWETESYYNRKITHEDKKENNHIKELIQDGTIKKVEDHYKVS